MATRVMGARGGAGGRAPLPASSRRSCRSGRCSTGVRWAGISGGAADAAMAGPGRVATSGRAAATSGRAATSDGVPAAAAIAPNAAAGDGRNWLPRPWVHQGGRRGRPR